MGRVAELFLALAIHGIHLHVPATLPPKEKKTEYETG
jgi:hypothetical protein